MDFVAASVFLALLVLPLTYFIKYSLIKIRVFVKGNKLPGPKGWPLIGNALEFLERDLDILDRLWKYNREFGLVRIWLALDLNVFICTAEDAETYYLSSALHDRSYHFDFLKYFLGNGLLTANGPHWKKSKRLMEPSFRYSSLQSFFPLLHEKTDILVSRLQKKVGKPAFPIYEDIKNCTFDIITRAMCDLEFNSQVQKVQILESAEVLMGHITARMYSVWQQYDFLYKFTETGKDFFTRLKLVKDYVDDMIADKKRFVKENEKPFQRKGAKDLKRIPFLQRLIEQEEWNDDEIRDHVMTMVATGYETVACHVSFMLVLLGIHHDVQEKLYEELSCAMENGSRYKELEKLEYLDKVIKESMRILPVAPILFRKASADVQFGQHLVPEGASIGINIFAIHRNPKYYDNPNAFNPENFSKEKVAERHPFAFVPFGGGIRRCIGEKFALMVIRTIITKIFLNYKVECDLRLEDIHPRLDVTLKMKNGFPIRLLKR